MRNSNRRITTYFILCSLLLIGVIYAILQSNLQINGTAKIQANNWDIHFNNIVVNENSVSIGTGDSSATIDPENNCKIDFEVTLSLPGDFYEFTVDVVNAGTIDGMIGELNKTLKVNNEVASEIPNYLTYLVTYADGMEIQTNHKIEAGVTETYKVRLEFKTDIEELPSAATITTSLEPQYIQADSSSIPKPELFVEGTWSQIVEAYNSEKLIYLQTAMEAGTTREVNLDLDNDGIPETTGHLRIANLSTPSECETAGFSQTACGFVIEFADIITKHNYNSAESNVGGWPASSMYNYVNTDIYNSLPSDLKNKIIETNVVSGHGSTSGETNFTSIDRVYLFSTKEIWGKEGTSNPVTYDSAEEETRQLDYYSYKNVTTVNNSNRTYAIKEDLSESESYWGLRTAVSIDDASFFRVKNNGSWSYRFSKYLEGISPAFRIAK
ncbi:MAG: hypothetical protein IJG68_06225 [Bacilli bacterium]|nr:hypothetical protein [Bacilli bacterium]